MRKLAVLLTLGASLGLMAQEGQKWGVAHVVGDRFDNTSDLKNRIGGGLGAGMWTDNLIGLDLRGIYMPQKSEAGTKSKEIHALVSVMFNLRPGADNWYPYIAVGPGITRAGRGVDSSSYTGKLETVFNYHGGVGLMGRITENLLVQGDVKLMRVDLPNPVDRNELLASLGVGYTWGGRKATPVTVSAPTPAPEPVVVPAPAPEPVVVPAPVPEPVPEPVVVKPAPAPEPIKIVLDEATLHFKNGKSDLSPKAVEAIQRVATSIKSYSGDYTIVVGGHTSSVGSLAMNKALSKRRADAVAKVLVDSGVKASAVSTEGYGPDKPIADNATVVGQNKNRRVEIDVNLLGAKAEVREHVVGLEEAPAAAPKAKVKAKSKKK